MGLLCMTLMLEPSEDVKLSVPEVCYFQERFGDAVVSLDRLIIEEVVGEGLCKKLIITTTIAILLNVPHFFCRLLAMSTEAF